MPMTQMTTKVMCLVCCLVRLMSYRVEVWPTLDRRSIIYKTRTIPTYIFYYDYVSLRSCSRGTINTITVKGKLDKFIRPNFN